MSTARKFAKMRDYPAHVRVSAAGSAYRRWLATEPAEHLDIHKRSLPCGRCLGYWMRGGPRATRS